MENITMLKISDVVKITGIAKSTIYRRLKEGTFPKQYHQGTRAVAWRSSDINNFLKNLSN